MVMLTTAPVGVLVETEAWNHGISGAVPIIDQENPSTDEAFFTLVFRASLPTSTETVKASAQIPQTTRRKVYTQMIENFRVIILYP